MGNNNFILRLQIPFPYNRIHWNINMVYKCSVKNCKSHDNSFRKCTLFSVPVDPTLKELWNRVVSENNNNATVVKKVCELHFTNDDLIRSYVNWPNNVSDQQRSIPRLQKSAVPSIFGNTINKIKCTEITPVLERQFSSQKSLKCYHGPKFDPTNNGFKDIALNDICNDDAEIENTQYLSETSKIPLCRKKLVWGCSTPIDNNKYSNNSLENQLHLSDYNSSFLSNTQYYNDSYTHQELQYIQFFQHLKSINLPSGWSFIQNETTFVFFLMKIQNDDVPKAIVEKQIVILHNFHVSCYALNIELKPSSFELESFEVGLNNIERIVNLLMLFDKKNICIGGPKAISFSGISVKSAKLNHGTWYHYNCRVVIDSLDVSRCKECEKLVALFRVYKTRYTCGNVKKNITQTLTPNRKHSLSNIVKQKHKLQVSNIRLKNTVQKVNDSLVNMQKKMENITFDSLLSKANLNESQEILINEILRTSSVKPRNRRYSENWILLCILFHIRSPSAYSFLRLQEILPLPCPRTIRNYLSIVQNQCGFDQKFFLVLKKKMSMFNSQQKHGNLIFDEISLRTSISVNCATLTYSGLEDYGNDMPCEHYGQKADHALVFMFQSYAANFSQPIAVFTTKGPVKGYILAQLVIKAISLLENSGAIVDGLVSDGASTNRKLWNEFGVSGKLEESKNFFMHPLNDKRKVYVFSDAPHLLKTVRNRLHDKKYLKFSDTKKCISWFHFVEMHKIDTINDINGQINLRVCPKITMRHLNLDTLSKMSVKLASQVLSNSMANALEFYRNRKCVALQGSEETQDFVKRFNDTFDALNRRHKIEGIKLNSNDFKVLESTINWLNIWEQNNKDGNISDDEFLTRSTAEGLRVTLQSTMDLSKYLLNDCGYHYVLSNKFNQDQIEMFFGTIRQATGPNDHPSTPTFIQVYKMLSLYSVLKPPKTGNCKILDSSPPKITITDIKQIFSSNDVSACNSVDTTATTRTDLVSNFKLKLDTLIQEETWEAESIFEDHNYFQASTISCVIYYVCGYVCRKIFKTTKCCTCLETLKGSTEPSTIPEATLTVLKSKGKLIYPNIHIFNLVSVLEKGFSIHCTNIDVFQLTLNYLLENYTITFPCKVHSSEVVKIISIYYVSMRMRQYCSMQNRQQQKTFIKKKKLSKLTTT